MGKKLVAPALDGFASNQTSNSWVQEAKKYKKLSKSNPVKVTKVNAPVNMDDKLRELYKEFYSLRGKWDKR